MCAIRGRVLLPCMQVVICLVCTKRASGMAAGKQSLAYVLSTGLLLAHRQVGLSFAQDPYVGRAL